MNDAKKAPRGGPEASRTAKALSRGLGTRKNASWIALAVVAVLLLVYRRFLLSGLDLVAEATGSRWTALLSLTLGLLALSSVLAWMFLPVFIYFGLRDLRRHAAELERATNLCAHHLSQLAADRRELSPPRLPGLPRSASEPAMKDQPGGPG
jgi:hypothetical protein